MSKMVYRYQVYFEPEEEGGYHAHVPALPGCHTYGATIEEAQERIKEAIALYVEGLEKHKLLAPPADNGYIGLIEVEVKPHGKKVKKIGAALRA
jgi:predicted RNase H-like HicB family nuclease